ncbi:uncharacterized protein N7487_011669 [Penicillium crustosum]|uniref:uncharacterized protein n=1 Tax=Penicillium crustosum TaxID=36656 RepID=UPI002395AD9C|nr:uncharacterized protein N7487_011669 [Penicillium crustosum]KAJ5394028.1 hypothetical protein N7487_011669 [Penicillium crustosum]
MRATASPNHTTMMLRFLDNCMSALYSAPSITITDLNRALLTSRSMVRDRTRKALNQKGQD